MMHIGREQSTAKAVRVCVTVRVCACSQRELFTSATHGPLAAVVWRRRSGSDVCKAFTVMESGFHYALLTLVHVSPQRVRGESRSK